MRRSPILDVRLLQTAAAMVLWIGLPGAASASTIVLQPATGTGVVAQEFPDAPTFTAYELDDFTTAIAYNVTTLTAFGEEAGAPALNIAVTGQIWSGLPGSGGVLVMSGSGTQVGADLVIDFGGQLLQAGSYWLTAFVTRPFGSGGQWFWSTHTPVTGSQAYFYNPGGGFGAGILAVPGSSFFGTAIDMAFHLEGNAVTPVPEPATLLLLGSGLAVAARKRFVKRS